MGSHPANLAFLLELAALAALGVWGWSLSTGAMRAVTALAAPIAVRGALRLAGELTLFAFAAWALAQSGHAALGIGLAIAVAIHYAISYDRIAWLIAR